MNTFIEDSSWMLSKYKHMKKVFQIIEEIQINPNISKADEFKSFFRDTIKGISSMENK
jgi:hypothetical protein